MHSAYRQFLFLSQAKGVFPFLQVLPHLLFLHMQIQQPLARLERVKGKPATRFSLVGGITDAQLKQYQFDIAFIGVVGVDLELNRVSTYITCLLYTSETPQKELLLKILQSQLR